jgi:hypothetical protein
LKFEHSISAHVAVGMQFGRGLKIPSNASIVTVQSRGAAQQDAARRRLAEMALVVTVLENNSQR